MDGARGLLFTAPGLKGRINKTPSTAMKSRRKIVGDRINLNYSAERGGIR
jgi:hypothetical protein